MAMYKSLTAQLCTLSKCNFNKTEGIPENILTGLITVTSRRLNSSKGKKSKIKNATTNVTKCRKKSSDVFCILSLFFSLRKMYLIHLILKGLPRNTSLCLLSLLILIGAQTPLGTSELLFMVANVFCSLLEPVLSLFASLPHSLSSLPPHSHSHSLPPF